MHKFLRAIGFSNLKKKELEKIVSEIVEKPTMMTVAEDSEGNEFAELSKEFGLHRIYRVLPSVQG